jgi:hypothetical protein
VIVAVAVAVHVHVAVHVAGNGHACLRDEGRVTAGNHRGVIMFGALGGRWEMRDSGRGRSAGAGGRDWGAGRLRLASQVGRARKRRAM